jgi:hypothetical protein
LAEDTLRSVREHIDGMARHRGLDLSEVEIRVITSPVLRLDQDRDGTRLWKTAKRLRPRLLLLDSLVRLHGILQHATLFDRQLHIPRRHRLLTHNLLWFGVV